MKKGLTVASVFICLIAIYNVLLFCLCKNLTKNVWIGYAFIMGAFVIMLASFLLSMSSKRSHHVVGLPLTTLSLYYFIAEFILANCLMFFNISFLAIFLPQIVLFLVFLMIYAPAVIRFLSLPKENSVENKDN